VKEPPGMFIVGLTGIARQEYNTIHKTRDSRGGVVPAVQLLILRRTPEGEKGVCKKQLHYDTRGSLYIQGYK
jgi:hypothetical protein